MLELNSLIVKFGLSATSDGGKAISDSSNDLLDTRTLYTNLGAEMIKKSVGKRFALEFLNGFVYISSNDQHFSYSGELSDIKEIFEETEIICYDGKAIYHKLRKAGCDLRCLFYIRFFRCI